MKRFLFLLAAVALFVTASAQTQSNDQRRSRQELATKQAQHIARQLALDDDVAAKFVDAYCDYQAELWSLGARPGQRRDGSCATEAGAEQTIKARFDHSQKLLDLRQKYYERYSKFLTQRQIERVYQLEKQMMRRLSGQRGRGQQQQGRPARRGR